MHCLHTLWVPFMTRLKDRLAMDGDASMKGGPSKKSKTSPSAAGPPTPTSDGLLWVAFTGICVDLCAGPNAIVSKCFVFCHPNSTMLFFSFT